RATDGDYGTVHSLYEDTAGTLWAATTTDRVLRWKTGSPQAYAIPGGVYPSLQVLSAVAAGAIAVNSRGGITQIVGDKIERFAFAKVPGVKPGSLFTDRDGAIWIGTRDTGLIHLHRGRSDGFTRADGLSGDSAYWLFEDREGNIWVATNEGID